MTKAKVTSDKLLGSWAASKGINFKFNLLEVMSIGVARRPTFGFSLIRLFFSKRINALPILVGSFGIAIEAFWDICFIFLILFEYAAIGYMKVFPIEENL